MNRVGVSFCPESGLRALDSQVNTLALKVATFEVNQQRFWSVSRSLRAVVSTHNEQRNPRHADSTVDPSL